MTWDRLIATGSGVLSYALIVEGWPEIFVTDPSITYATNADGRTVVSGLSYQGLQMHDRILPLEGKCQASGMTFRLEPTTGQRLGPDSDTDPILQSVSTYPDPVGRLVSNWDSTTAGFPGLRDGGSLGPGVWHIGTEAFRRGDGVDARHIWDTQAQEHNPEYLDSSVYVYDRPPSMEGRRAYLTAYADGDDLAGAGTLIWRGVVTRQPRSVQDGNGTVAWMIECAGITDLLRQKIGGGVGSARPTGIYLNAGSSMWIEVNYEGTTTEFFITGLFTEETLIAAVNLQLASALSALFATSEFSKLTFAPTVEGGWAITAHKVSPGTQRFLSIRGGSLVTGYFHVPSTITSWVNQISNEVVTGFAPLGSAGDWVMVANWDDRFFRNASNPGYSYSAAAHNGQVLGCAVNLTIRQFDGQSRSGLAGTWPTNRVYVDADPTGWTTVRISDLAGEPVAKFGPGNPIDTGIYNVEATGSTSISTSIGSQAFHYIELDGQFNMSFNGVLNAESLVERTKVYAQAGSVADFVTALVAQSVKANDGDTPFITDVDFGPGAVALPQDFSQDVGIRQYAFVKPLAVDEVLARELQFAACLLRIGSTGGFEVRPIPIAVEGSGIATIDHSNILTPGGGGGGFPTVEPQRDGVVSSVTVQQVYNAIEGNWRDQPLTIQDADMVSTHKNRGRGHVEIKPYSSPMLEPNHDYVHALASRYLSFGSKKYAVITVQVPFTLFGLRCGDVVNLTHRLIPDGSGNRGVTARACTVIERRWNLDPARPVMGTLVLWMSAKPVYGYAPSAFVTGQTDNGGDEWTLACDTGDERNVAVSTDRDGDVASSFREGDKVRIVELDTETPTEVLGAVVSTAAGEIVVQFDDTWDPASNAWMLIYQVRADVLDSQKRYVFVADDTTEIGGEGRVFA